MINFGLAGFYGDRGLHRGHIVKAGVDGFTAAVAAIGDDGGALGDGVAGDAEACAKTISRSPRWRLPELVRLVLMNETWLTGGTNGIRDIPRPLIGLVGGDHYEVFFLLLVPGAGRDYVSGAGPDHSLAVRARASRGTRGRCRCLDAWKECAGACGSRHLRSEEPSSASPARCTPITSPTSIPANLQALSPSMRSWP